MLRLSSGKFCGSVENTFDGQYARISKALYQAGQVQPLHTHTLPHICLTAAGTYEETVNSFRRTIPRGAITFYHPEQLHSDSHQTNGIHFVIEIKPVSLTDLLPSFFHDPIYSGRAVSLAWQIYAEFHKRDAFSPLALEALSLELLVESFRPPFHSGSIWLKRAIEFIHECLPRNPSLSEIARHAGVHPVHLAKMFRRSTGFTIGEYIRRQRIDFASRRLTTTRDPLAKIALDAGFADQTHFTRLFKKYMSMTPRQFRKLT